MRIPAQRQSCPSCLSQVRMDALKCPHCQSYLPADRTDDRTKQCPHCREWVLAWAQVCFLCRRDLTAKTTTYADAVRDADPAYFSTDDPDWPG